MVLQDRDAYASRRMGPSPSHAVIPAVKYMGISAEMTCKKEIAYV